MSLPLATTPAPVLQISLLGGFQVAINGQQVPERAWRQTRVAALIKLLALEPTHRLHREPLMDTLWPDLDLDAQANTLRQMLHRARGHLTAVGGQTTPFLAREGTALVLGPDGQVHVDVDAFEQAVTEAWRTDDPTSVQRALDCYHGDLLPEDPFEDWAENRRTLLRTSYLTLLSRLAHLDEQRGQSTRAILLLQRLVATEPTDEPAHVTLMRLYAESGQRQQALAQYEHLITALRDELGVDPERASQELAEAIRAGRVPVVGAHAAVDAAVQPTGAARHTLPLRLTPLLGRARELAELEHLVRTQRLLTLTGPGGIGKTRLALALGQAIQQQFRDGAAVIDLAPVRDPEVAVNAMAEGLGLREDGRQSRREQLSEWLRSRQLLLVLDNFEQVLAAAPIVTALLEQAPHLTVLVTSRTRLRLRGEQDYPVGPLDVPAPDQLDHSPLAELVSYPAIALFVARAQAIVPTFAVTLATAPVVAAICRRLDGLPLAIELAAARSNVLPPAALLERLRRPLAVLTGGARDLPARQQTIRATIAWSYDLLDPPEQRLLQRLSVFVGGWTLEAAEAVVDPPGEPGINVLDGLQALVDASLVVQRASAADPARFGLLETIRAFGIEQLDRTGEGSACTVRHAAYFGQLAERAEPAFRGGADQHEWFARIEDEQDNLRAALAWSLANDVELALQMGAALWRFWDVRGQYRFGRSLLEQGIALAENPPARLLARAQLGIGGLARWMGDDVAGRAALASAITLFHEVGDRSGLSDALHVLGAIAVDAGEYEQARTAYEASLALRRTIGDRWGVALSLTNLGSVWHLCGDLDHAQHLYEESGRLLEMLGDERRLAGVLSNLGEIADDRGMDEQARGYYQRSLVLSERHGYHAATAYTAQRLGRLELRGGRLRSAWTQLATSVRLHDVMGVLPQAEEDIRLLAGVACVLEHDLVAVELLSAAAAVRRGSDDAPTETAHAPTGDPSDEAIAVLRLRIGDEVFAANWAEGQRLSPVEIIDRVADLRS